jgi:hypothetical protein
MANKNDRDLPNGRARRRRARAARARGWYWEDFSEEKLAKLHVTELTDFLNVARELELEWDELTPGEQRLARLACKGYDNWYWKKHRKPESNGMTEDDKNGIQRFLVVVEDELERADDVNVTFKQIVAHAGTLVPAGADREEFERRFRILIQPLVDLELKRRKESQP